MKIVPFGVELFHADGQVDGLTVLRNLMVAFCSFVNAPKKMAISVYLAWSS